MSLSDHQVIHRLSAPVCQVRFDTGAAKASATVSSRRELTGRKRIRAIVPKVHRYGLHDLLRRFLPFPLRHATTPVYAGLTAAGVLLLVFSFVATSDWLRFSAARKLAGEAAAAGALAAARLPDPVDVTAGAAVRLLFGEREVKVVAERGDARPGPAGLVFSAGRGDVVRVTLSSTVRSLLGTPVGLGQRTVTASAVATRSGVASLVERTTALPALPAVPAALEARLFGPSAALTVNERDLLGRYSFSVDALVAELGRRLADRDGGGKGGSSAVAAASFKPSELLTAVGALFRDPARASADASAVLAVLDRMSAAATDGEPLPFSAVISLSGADRDLSLAAPLRLLELVQAVMRARLAIGEATIDLADPVVGISAARLSLRSTGTAAAALVGGENGFVGIPAIGVTARFKLAGLSIAGISELELPLEVTLESGDARIKRIVCGAAGPEVTVTGRPVRAGVRLAEPDAASSPAGASDYVRLVSSDGITAWGKGRSAFADDPPATLVFRPGSGETVASLRAPIDFRNRLERLASETQILVSIDGASREVMSEGGVRDELARLFAGAVGPIETVLSSLFATLGVVPGKMDVVAAGASCNNATLLAPIE